MSFGESKMAKTKVNLRTGSTEDFFRRARERAKRLDSGEKLPAELTINFEDPAELLKILSSERVRLLRLVKGAPLRVSVLATGLRRDVRAVNRDVSLLEKAGLLRTRYEANPGHGRRKIVEPVAREFRLVANL
jgi:predicted transcriptional regulator